MEKRANRAARMGGNCLVFVLGACVSSIAGDFKYSKQVVSPLYDSEGADMGDFNKDGKMDLVSGPFWYEGPDFKVKHEYQPAKVLDPKAGYTSNYFAWADDYNGDGWTDIFTTGIPGNAGYWYQNPGAGDIAQPKVMWTRREAIAVLGNESPDLADLNGDGKQEMLYNTNDGFIRWAAPDPANPAGPWKEHNITTKGAQSRYTHGLGLGDINLDGRLDLLEKDGWWEQPASLAGDPAWKQHPYPFAPAKGGAQMFAYDIDGDGDQDVASTIDAHGWGLSWFEHVKASDGGIEFVKHPIMGTRAEVSKYGLAFSQPHALALLDVDGDGLQDLVTGKRKWGHGTNGDVEPNEPWVIYAFQLRRAGGIATFTPYPIDSTSGVGTQLEAKDIDGDGLKDLLVGNKNGTFVFRKLGIPNASRALQPANGLQTLHKEGNGYDALGVARYIYGGTDARNKLNKPAILIFRP